MAGISIREYARRKGVSHVAVIKWIDRGLVTPLEDGKIDPEAADQQLALHRDPDKAPEPEEKLGVDAVEEIDEFVESLTSIKIDIARQMREQRMLDLGLRRGDLVERRKVERQATQRGQEIQDLILNWPARVVDNLAAELDVRTDLLEGLLQKHLTELLEDLASKIAGTDAADDAMRGVA